jgi:hypothetical protein
VEGHACDQLQPQPRTSGEVGAELLKKSTLTDGSWRNIAIAPFDPDKGEEKAHRVRKAWKRRNCQ